MKKCIFLIISMFVYTSLLASQKKLLQSRAIFRVGPLQSDEIGHEEGFYRDEILESYVGRPVSAKVTVDGCATSALRVLIGFVGADQIRYACKPFPELKQGEICVIHDKFREDTQSFLLKIEKENYCCCCVVGKELVQFETGYADPEKK